MKPLYKGVLIALVHLCIVSSLGAKLLYDRATCPRVWVLAAPFDPNLPIRGRYVSLQLVVEPVGIVEPAPTGAGWTPPLAVVLSVKNGRLVAESDPRKTLYSPEGPHVGFVEIRQRKHAVLDQPVAFFIPEHVPDPSRRAAEEELWVEVTLPRKGPPRPIRLGVKRGDGPIVPLVFN